VADSNLGYRATTETKRKMSLASIGKKRIYHISGEELSEIRRIQNTGHVASEETKRKMSESRKGYIMKESSKEKLRIAHTGKTMSEEAKELISLNSGSAKTYSGIVSPGGAIYNNIHNLARFCREHNLYYNCMKRLVSGIRKQHIGWTYIGH
jgi:hypothetical protein